MSGWGLGWFGGGAAKKKDAPKTAILNLRSTLDMLSKREKHLEAQIAEQQAIARKNVSSNKNGIIPAPSKARLHVPANCQSVLRWNLKWHWIGVADEYDYSCESGVATEEAV